jgi:hypothetical protein
MLPPLPNVFESNVRIPAESRGALATTALATTALAVVVPKSIPISMHAQGTRTGSTPHAPA